MNENATPMTAAPAASIPEDVLIILPASDAVLFPGVVTMRSPELSAPIVT